MNKPAILGGKPVFSVKNTVPILRPTLPDIKELLPDLKKSFRLGQITNASNVRRFEEMAAEYIGVKYCIAVSSCTTGLILVHKCLDLKGEVIVPSFTFHATVHSLVWNNLKPVFIDCREDTFNIDEKKIKDLVTKDTSAILAVYMYGNPPAMEDLQLIADRYNLKLIFDAAQAFGARFKGIPAGRFGNAEIFSLSPTKLLIAGEGGLVSTNDKSLAERLRVARNYGDPGNYDCSFSGFNARMGEFNAILAIKGLRVVDKKVKKRNRVAMLYTDFFKNYKGISFQQAEDGNVCNFKDYSIVIDPELIGIGRDILAIALKSENIDTRKYFYPPVHMQKAFKFHGRDGLNVTEKISSRVLSLPVYNSLRDEEIEKICYAFERIFKYKDKISRIKS